MQKFKTYTEAEINYFSSVIPSAWLKHTITPRQSMFTFFFLASHSKSMKNEDFNALDDLEKKLGTSSTSPNLS